MDRSYKGLVFSKLVGKRLCIMSSSTSAKTFLIIQVLSLFKINVEPIGSCTLFTTAKTKSTFAISRFRDRSLKRDKSASRSSELDSSPNSAGSRSHDGDQDDDDDSLDMKSKKLVTKTMMFC